eukprot:gene1336-11418_t
MKVEKLKILSPISSISFDEKGEFICYSMGSCFCVENFKTKKKIFEKILIDGGKIYGIKIYDDFLCIFGQRIFKLFKFSVNNDNFELEEILTFEAKFWILDVKKLENDMFVIGYSSNSVEIFLFQNSNLKSLKFLKGTLNCLLYSMRLHGNSLNDLVIASGTIFHDILIWNVDQKLLRTLKGHVGVIFCVEISKDGNWLISASDDRTIKLWNLKDISQEEITLYGHSARIWDCKFLSDDRIVSCSEDSLVKIWNFQGNSLKTLQGHTGKNVWKISIHPNQKLIASGGSDCSIKLWNINENKMKKLEIKNIKGIDISNRNIKIITKEGLIYLIKEEENEILFNFGETKNFSVLSSDPWNKNFCMIGDVSGNIYIIDFQLKKVIFQQKITKSRILKIFWSKQKNQTFVFITSAEGNLHQFIWKHGSLHKIDFINTGKKVITSLCCNASNLLIGDSKGYIKLYQFFEDKMNERPLSSIKSHPNVNISDINYSNGFYYSVGWDGRISVYFIENMKLVVLHSYKLNTIIKCIERIIFSDNQDLIVYGYSGNLMILYNFTQKYRIDSIDFGLHIKESRIIESEFSSICAFSDDKQLNIYNEKFEPTLMLNFPAFHSREIYDCKFMVANNKIYVFTCGEDTKIFISEFEKERLKFLDCLEEHDSSVRCLNIIQSNNQFFLVSAGGKEELIIWRIFIEEKLFLKKLLSTSSKDSIFYNLKLNSKSIEYRILAIASMMINENRILLITGGSDSLIKFFIYDIKKNELNPLGYSNFHEGNVSQLLVKRDGSLLISTGTEGNIAIFDILNIEKIDFHLIKPKASFKAHKSGITSLSAYGTLLATGGDDQIINVFDLTKMTEVESSSIKNQHFAQVTGIFINDNMVVSTSIDQKLNIFSIKNLKLTLNVSVQLDITNILNMTILEENKEMLIIVVGSGIQILKILKDFM